LLEEVKYAANLIWFCTCVLTTCECAQCETVNQMTVQWHLSDAHYISLLKVASFRCTLHQSSKIILYYMRIKVVKCILSVNLKSHSKLLQKFLKTWEVWC